MAQEARDMDFSRAVEDSESGCKISCSDSLWLIVHTGKDIGARVAHAKFSVCI